MSLLLPSIKVANLNLWWTNGSRTKPGAPIPIKIKNEFEEKEDHKINWLSDVTGLITLEGEYNYLIFKDSRYYFLVKTSVIDIEKEIYVYTLTLDYWMTFISNPNNYVNGCLIKTSDESLVWRHIQKTNAAISEVNSETVLQVCTNESCTIENIASQLTVVPFNKDEKGTINQFGSRYRFGRKTFKAFIDKLSLKYHNVEPKPNKIYAFCPLIKVLKWENYIAKLIEDFLTDRGNLYVGSITPSDLNSFSTKLSSTLKDTYGFDKTYYSLVKGSGNHVKATEDKETVINNIDFSTIRQIRLVDKTTLEEQIPSNRSIFKLYEESSEVKIQGINYTTWDLQNKMYSPMDVRNTYKNYLNIGLINVEHYPLNTELLESLNLQPLDEYYTVHGYKFPNNYVPAIYYQTWSDVIQDDSLITYIRTNNINTELGFLLYKISDYYNTTLKVDNKYVYNGKSLFITTGIKLKDEEMLCTDVYDLKTKKPVTGKTLYSVFSEIYREPLSKSLWMTLWSVYLWQGELDRIFVGLYVGGLIDDFKYTVPKCHIKNDKLWTYDEYLKSKPKIDYDERVAEVKKLPSYEEPSVSFTRNKKEYGDALKEIAKRRKKIEINQPLLNIPIQEGDIYWNEYQHGYYTAGTTVKEKTFRTPALVVYSDVRYSYNLGDKEIWSLKENDTKGYKIGLLNKSELNELTPNPLNVITSDLRLPYIYYIKPLLLEFPSGITYNTEKFSSDMQEFLINRIQQPGLFKEEKILLEATRWIDVALYDKNNTPWWNDAINIKKLWIKDDSNNISLIKSVDTINEWGFPYVRVHLLNGWTQLIYVVRKKVRYLGDVKKDFLHHEVAAYIKNNLLYSKYIGGSVNINSVSSDSLEAVMYDTLLPDKTTFDTNEYKKYLDTLRPGSSFSTKGKLYSVFKETYQNINDEKIDDTKQSISDLDEEFLKEQGKEGNKLLFELKTLTNVLMYAIINWPKDASKPTIQLIIADKTLLSKEKISSITLSENNLVVNNNLVQVVNQQNYLYVYGHNFPIKTKIITNKEAPIFNFKVDPIIVEDNIQAHYLVYFEGDRDLIKTNISVVKKEIASITGTTNQQELLNMRWQMAENAKNRHFDQLKQKEEERKGGVYLRHKEQDIHWDETTGRSFVIASAVGNIAGGIIGSIGGFAAAPLTKGVSAVTGALGIGGSIASAVSLISNHERNITLARRELGEKTLQHAFNVEQSKNTLDHRHKYEELRDKNRLYEAINTVITTVPNNADILEELQRKDLIKNGIAIINRMPKGELLDLLIEFHKNWGYDLTVNNHLLSVKELNKDNTIYQFSRVDIVSVEDLNVKEAITNIFTNGIYLKKIPYVIKNIPFVTAKKIEKEDAIKKQIATTKKEKEENKKELNLAKAAAEGVEKARQEYDALVREKDKCKVTLDETKIALNKATQKILKLEDDILSYQAHDKLSRGDFDRKLNELIGAKEVLEGEKLDLQNRLDTKTNEYNLINTQLEQGKEQINNLTTEKDRALLNLQAAETEADKKDEAINKKDEELGQIRTNLASITDQLNIVKGNLEAKTKEFNSCIAAGVSDASAIQAFQSEIKRLQGKEAELMEEKAKSARYLGDVQRIRTNYNNCVRLNNACIGRERLLKTNSEAKIKELEKDKTDILQQASRLTDELNTKDELIATQIRDLTTKDEQIRLLQETNNNITQSLEECEGRVPDTALLDTCKEDLRQKKEDLSIEKAKTAAQARTIQQQTILLTRKTSQLDQEKKAHDKTKNSLAEKNSDLVKKSQELTTERRNSESLKSRVVSITKAKGVVDQALKDCEAGQTNISELRTQIRNLTSIKEANEQTIQGATDALNDELAEVNKQKKEVKRLQEELDTCLNSRVERQTLTTCQANLTREQTKASRLEREKTTLNSSLQDAQKQLNECKIALEQKDVRITSLEGDLQRQQRIAGDLTTQLGTCLAGKINADELQRWKNEISRLEGELKNCSTGKIDFGIWQRCDNNLKQCHGDLNRERIKITQLEDELKLCKKPSEDPGCTLEECNRLKAALVELAKKKNKLEEARKTYAKAWIALADHMKDNTAKTRHFIRTTQIKNFWGGKTWDHETNDNNVGTGFLSIGKDDGDDKNTLGISTGYLNVLSPQSSTIDTIIECIKTDHDTTFTPKIAETSSNLKFLSYFTLLPLNQPMESKNADDYVNYWRGYILNTNKGEVFFYTNLENSNDWSPVVKLWNLLTALINSNEKIYQEKTEISNYLRTLDDILPSAITFADEWDNLKY